MNQELSNVVNNTSPSKKSNKTIIIAVVAILVVALVVGGIFVGKSLLGKNKEEVMEEDKFATYEITGTVELAKKSTTKISRVVEYTSGYNNIEHFVSTEKDGSLVVLDANGNKLLPVKGYDLYKDSNMFYKYLGDGYFIYNTKNDDDVIGTVIVKDGEYVTNLDEHSYIFMSYCHYKDGILYASPVSKDYSIAYDIANKKELWRFDGYFIPRYTLDDNFIRLSSNENSSGGQGIYFRDPFNNTIFDYNGNKIISGADMESDDIKIYTSKNDTYIEYKENDYLKVYDLNKNLKATLSLVETDNIEYNLTKIHDSGLFTIAERDKSSNEYTYVLYNTDGKEVIRNKSISSISYKNDDKASYNLPKEYDMFEYWKDDKLVYAMVKNGEIVANYVKYDYPVNIYNDTNDYMIVYEEGFNDGPIGSGYKAKLLNVNTMESVSFETKRFLNSSLVNIGLNGSYAIITDDTTNFVYDSKLNKKYESSDNLIPVNDKYILSNNTKDNVLKLINIETGKENTLDVKGKYYNSNSRGLVTYDGEFYYLYTFK